MFNQRAFELGLAIEFMLEALEQSIQEEIAD
jgi:hypothetical protein